MPWFRAFFFVHSPPTPSVWSTGTTANGCIVSPAPNFIRYTAPGGNLGSKACPYWVFEEKGPLRKRVFPSGDGARKTGPPPVLRIAPPLGQSAWTANEGPETPPRASSR